FPVAVPEIAPREIPRGAQKDTTTNLVVSKGAPPRGAPFSTITEPREPIPISNSRSGLGALPRLAGAGALAFMDDGYIRGKLALHRRLDHELKAGRTRLCLELDEI